jgi:chromosome segregation ATPase
MSEHTKRWSAQRGTIIHESSKGEFVLHSDYAELEAQLAERDEKISLQQHALDINNYRIGELESGVAASQQNYEAAKERWHWYAAEHEKLYDELLASQQREAELRELLSAIKSGLVYTTKTQQAADWSLIIGAIDKALSGGG